MSFVFKDDLGDVAMRRLYASLQAVIEEFGLVETAAVGAQLPPELIAAGIAPQISRGMMYLRRNEDGSVAERLEVSRDGARFEDNSYIRWAPFRDRALKALEPVYQMLALSTQLLQAANEYNDVFVAADGVDDPDASEVVLPTSPLIAPASFSPRGDFHTFSGWFEDREPPLRRVVNANIDVASRGDPSRKTLRVMTRCVERPIDPEADAPDWAEIVASFDASHQTLKRTLAMALTPRAIQAISLNP